MIDDRGTAMSSAKSFARQDRVWFVALLVGGALAWLAIAAIGGRREAWDSALYFVAGVPLFAAACFVAGLRRPARVWRWPLALAIGQSLALSLGNGEPTLWPLMLIAFCVLGAPSWIAALIAARLSASRA